MRSNSSEDDQVPEKNTKPKSPIEKADQIEQKKKSTYAKEQAEHEERESIDKKDNKMKQKDKVGKKNERRDEDDHDSSEIQKANNLKKQNKMKKKEIKDEKEESEDEIRLKKKKSQLKGMNKESAISKKLHTHSSEGSDHNIKEGSKKSTKVVLTDNRSYKKFIAKFESTKAAKKMLKNTGYRVVINSDNKEVLWNENGEKFVYEDEKSYKLTADYLNNYIQMRMTEQYGLEKKSIPFPKDMTDKDYSTAPIFVSPGWKNNTKYALILIQGTGDVRAGLWARSVCLNESLEMGSMLPQIKYAVENGMECLIMNPNYFEDSNGNAVDPRINTMEKHCNYVFKKYVLGRCQAEKVFIIAHSAGGKCLATLFKRFTQEFYDRVKSIVLTDSAHKDIRTGLIDQEEEDYMSGTWIHFKKSFNKLGEKEDNSGDPILQTFSAGHDMHEYTTGSAWPKIQTIFRNMSGKELNKVDYLCYSKKSYNDSE